MCIARTLYGISGKFPAVYTGAVMIGVGLAGVVTALLRVITKVSYPATPQGNITLIDAQKSMI
jgi:hypothetical protein